MMNKKEVLTQIKILLGMETEPTEPIVEVQMTTAILKDGTNVTYESLMVGNPLMIQTSAETSTPAPEGSYTFKDGTTVEVGPDNLIIGFAIPEEPAMEPEPEVEVEVEEPEVEGEPEPDETETRIKSLEDQVAKLTEALNLLMENYNAMSTELSTQKEVVETIANEPAAEPIHLSKDPSKKKETKNETTYERRLRVLESLKK